jgi:hypothetical protein
MTAEQADAALSVHGKVEHVRGLDGDPHVSAGKYTAAICEGRVIRVTHELAPTFSAFARATKVRMAERGEPTYSIDSSEGDRSYAQIAAEWLRVDGVRYGVYHVEITGDGAEGLTTESISRLC